MCHLHRPREDLGVGAGKGEKGNLTALLDADVGISMSSYVPLLSLSLRPPSCSLFSVSSKQP